MLLNFKSDENKNLRCKINLFTRKDSFTEIFFEIHI